MGLHMSIYIYMTVKVLLSKPLVWPFSSTEGVLWWCCCSIYLCEGLTCSFLPVVVVCLYLSLCVLGVFVILFIFGSNV